MSVDPAQAVDRRVTALVDRYRVDRELGVSGMATDYRSHDIKHERDVAIAETARSSSGLGVDRDSTSMCKRPTEAAAIWCAAISQFARSSTRTSLSRGRPTAFPSAGEFPSPLAHTPYGEAYRSPTGSARCRPRARSSSGNAGRRVGRVRGQPNAVCCRQPIGGVLASLASLAFGYSRVA